MKMTLTESKGLEKELCSGLTGTALATSALPKRKAGRLRRIALKPGKATLNSIQFLHNAYLFHNVCRKLPLKGQTKELNLI